MPVDVLTRSPYLCPVNRPAIGAEWLEGGQMDVLYLIGRIIFAALFLGSSVAHLTDKGGMAGYAESRGVRPGRPMVLVSGLQILAGGLLVLLGIWTDVGAILLALFTLLTSVLIHSFWREKEPMNRMQEMIQFQKDMALCGASLILLFLAWTVDDLPFTITGPLFDL
jgi:putative oxidoreductase